MIATAFLCLALNVYFEGRGEPLAGQHAIAQITLNRAGHNPARICEVVAEPEQFSWVDGRVFKSGSGFVISPSVKTRDAAAWAVAKSVAYENLRGWVKPMVGSATSFHATRVRPAWAPNMRLVATIGRHKFYTKA
jgi:N-acetylmuramoyl-L-alanine amidase